jgi:CubicO group peptidase (beta-lactamase class C family)
MEVDSFANKHLFEPLGIERFEWTKFPTQSSRKDIPAAASGLRLTSRDLLKFGSLYMNNGKWKGQQILPESWVIKSHKSYISRNNLNQGYGYQFWIEKEDVKTTPTTRAVAVGNGGQRIFFDHQNKLLVVTTAGLYNQWDVKNNTDALLLNFIYPAFIK